MLGKTATDIVTGFTGTITGYVQYLSGFNQYLIVPKIKADGSLPAAQWFDVQRITISDAQAIKLDNAKTPGADQSPPIR